jgi:hypothetical protein
MAELTQADLDKAIKDALGKQREEFDAEVAGLKDKNKELIGKLREASGVKPEDLAAAEARADKAEAALNEANKALKAVTGERDKAVKALETEQGAARTFALEAELATAIAEGNVVPALVPAFKAMIAQQAKADLVDGKYAVTIGDKSARDHIKGFLDSDDGKAFRAAPVNGGGGAGGSGGATGGGKTMPRTQFDALDPAARMAAVKEGVKVVDQAA